MRSLAEVARRRGRVEVALRVAALAGLLGAIGAAWVLASRGLPGAAATLRVELTGTPSPLVRDSFAALARAGRSVSWHGSAADAAALAAMAEPVREPGDRWRVSAISEAALSIADSLGVLDSLPAGGGVITLDASRGALGVGAARVRPSATHELRRVLVLGRPGWESRFTITALEEAGWLVDARLPLGRGRVVHQGSDAISLARHSVVVVLDSASARHEAAALARFVRAGGGVVLAGVAARADAPALRAIAGARVGALEPPEVRSFDQGHAPTHALPLHALPLHALGALHANAVLIEDREGTPAVVARRVGAGRIIQFGYADSWRWRMEGEGRSVEEHRAYWSQLVGLVAAAVPVVLDERVAVDPAPMASLVHALGPATPEAPAVGARRLALPVWLGPLLLIALLAEWASRRARGLA